MRHLLINAARVLFFFIFLIPCTSVAVPLSSSSNAGLRGIQKQRIEVQDSLGKPGGSKLFWWNRKKEKSDVGSAFAISAALSVVLAAVLILVVPAAKGAFLLPLLVIALLASAVIYSIIGLFMSGKRRYRIISALALLFSIIMAFLIFR